MVLLGREERACGQGMCGSEHIRKRRPWDLPLSLVPVPSRHSRERKKAEHERLQDAVDMLTAQVATLKVSP